MPEIKAPLHLSIGSTDGITDVTEPIPQTLRFWKGDTDYFDIVLDGGSGTGSGTSFSTGLIQTGGISLQGSTVSIAPNILWKIDDVDYSKTTTSSFIINAASTSNYRRDLIYANTSGNLILIEGTEDPSIAVAPALPANSVEVTIIDVQGSVVSPPVSDPNAITDIQNIDAYTLRIYKGISYTDVTIGSTQNQQVNSSLVNLDQIII